MQLSMISPAPRRSQARASCTASMSRPSRPPFTVHWYQQCVRPVSGHGAGAATTVCPAASTTEEEEEDEEEDDDDDEAAGPST